jgi:tRNA modification GTPase
MIWSGPSEAIRGVVVTNVRHGRCVEEALEAVQRGIEAGAGAPEILALEIRDALEKLGEIVGETVTEDILDEVFSRFCVGK